MAKPAIKRNKAAARSCVILGTVLAGTAILVQSANAAKPALSKFCYSSGYFIICCRVNH